VFQPACWREARVPQHHAADTDDDGQRHAAERERECAEAGRQQGRHPLDHGREIELVVHGLSLNGRPSGGSIRVLSARLLRALT
jgi:hypothetical protein